MTAYAPRHAVTAPRTSRTPLWHRARRMLLSLLPAARVVMAPFADRFACCAHCTDGAPCEPRDNHLAPCSDGCNDPRPYDERHCAVPDAHGKTGPYYCTLPAHHYPQPDAPVTLTDAEIAALRPARLTPVEYANAMHAASRPYLPPLPASTLARRKPIAGRAPWPVTPTAELAVLTDAHTLAMYRGDWGTMPAERIIAAELPQVIA